MRPSRIVLRLSVGHFWIDAYASMLGALMPFLYRTHDLSFTQMGVLAGMLILSASFFQPFYGYLSDRWNSRVFTALGPSVAGLFICALGLTDSYPLMLVLVFLGGIGIAAFHPQGSAVASRSSRTNPGFQLSFFITCGMMGYAAGPVLMGSLLAFAGLSWSILAAFPGLLVTLYLLRSGPLPAIEERVAKHREVLSRLKDHSRPLLLLFSLVVIKSAMQMAFVAFLPLFLVLRGYSAVTASQILTLFLLVGASSGFVGGILMDHAGGKKVLVISMAGLVPCFLGFLATEGTISILLCVLGSGFLLLNSPVNVAMAQRLVPHGVGTVSALMMGFAWGFGGITVPIVGWASDSVGLSWSFLALVLLGLPGLVLALALPADQSLRVSGGNGAGPIGDVPPTRPEVVRYREHQ